MPQGMQQLLDKIQAGVDQIQTAELGERELEAAAENLCDSLSELSADHTQTTDTEIRACAVKLWNVVVARKVGGQMSATLNAKLRHVACSLIFLCYIDKEDNSTRQKQVMMALKTARAWLDSGKPAMADIPLTLAMDSLQKLCEGEDKAGREGPGGDQQVACKQSTDTSFFKLLCYQAEAAFGQDNVSRSMELVLQAKEMLHKLPQEASYLAMLAYNLGVDCFQAQNYEHAVNWLRESYEIGKGNIPSQNQARTLRLLANAYLEWDGGLYWQKALNVIGLANAEHCHAAGLFLKLRILLEGENNTDRIIAALDDLMSHADLTADLGLSAVKLLKKKKVPTATLR